jgi:hypothetical protein
MMNAEKAMPLGTKLIEKWEEGEEKPPNPLETRGKEEKLPNS